jgi:hypothetical protein
VAFRGGLQKAVTGRLPERGPFQFHNIQDYAAEWVGGREILLGVKQGQALGAPNDGLQEAGGGGPTVGGPLHNVHHVGEPLEEAVIQHHLHVTLQLFQVHLYQGDIFSTSTLVS